MADNVNSHCNCTKSVPPKLVSISLWGNMADNVTYCNCIKSVQTKLVSISLWGNMADNVTLTATVQRVFKQNS